MVVTSRTPERLTAFGWYRDVTAVSLDANDPPDSVATLFARCGHVDAVYYLVHGIGETDFRTTDNEGARRFALAAAEAGVGRIIYLAVSCPPTTCCPNIWPAEPKWLRRSRLPAVPNWCGSVRR